MHYCETDSWPTYICIYGMLAKDKYPSLFI